MVSLEASGGAETLKRPRLGLPGLARMGAMVCWICRSVRKIGLKEAGTAFLHVAGRPCPRPLEGVVGA
jgi:hypothetical protein